jgi:hypothetical protein
MVLKVTITEVSRNKKTGPILTTMTSPSSCPNSCALKGNGCYAEHGPTAIHWKAVDDKGMEWYEFCDALKEKLRGKTLWRHNVAGDLPTMEDGVTVSGRALGRLLMKAAAVPGFTYTHHPLNLSNEALFHFANSGDVGKFTINISADTLAQADDAFEKGLPTTVVVPSDWTGLRLTPKGNPVVICPAVANDSVTCLTCQLCAKADRKSIVGFPAHGARRRVINLRLESSDVELAVPYPGAQVGVAGDGQTQEVGPD